MLLYPKIYLESVDKIEIEVLKKNNIKGLILDVDNTLIDFNKQMSPKVKQWAKDIKKENIKMCILSNSNKEEKVKSVADLLGIPYIHFAKKPFKTGFLKAKKILNLDFANIAVVGDQIFTDIIGANKCKMFSILVKPIEKKDYLLTKIKRPFEEFVINRYLKSIKGRTEN